VNAYRVADAVLIKTDDPPSFSDVFKSVFERVDWSKLPQIIELNQEVYAEL
jgi:hypothetical protein